MYEYVQSQQTSAPSPNQVARIREIDARYGEAFNALPDAERRQVIVSRGRLAHLEWDWHAAARWYTDPRLSPEERAMTEPLLADMRRAGTMTIMEPLKQYADFSACRQ